MHKNPVLVYVANVRLPTEKAHGLQIVKTCQGLANNGLDVKLIVPYRRNTIHDSVERFFGIKQNFSLYTVKVPELRFLKKVGFILHTLFFVCRAILFVVQNKPEAVYSRDYIVLFFVSFLRIPTFYEAHTGNWNWWMRRSFKRLSGIVCITKGLENFYAHKGFSREKMVVVPDAVDPSLFKDIPSQTAVREKLSLPKDKKIVLYSGSFSLYGWKGLDTFIDTALLCDSSFLFVAVGGYKKEVENLQRVYSKQTNIVFRERVSPDVVPWYLRAADVLILPNKKGDRVSEEFTSPMKLFEYMASGIPLIASDLPSIREIIDESCAIIVPPDDPQAFAHAVTRSLEVGFVLAQKAQERVCQRYTWDIRGKRIRDFICKYD